jgi:hypothetical protein
MLLTATSYGQMTEIPGLVEKGPATAAVSAAVARAISEQYRVKPWRPDDVRASEVSLSNLAVRLNRQPMPVSQTATPGRQRSIRRKVLGAVVGATGGFFVGGFLGAKIDGECNCDDPGFVGFLVGAPIGSVAGGILGYKFLF